jgi:hypothetical protein
LSANLWHSRITRTISGVALVLLAMAWRTKAGLLAERPTLIEELSKTPATADQDAVGHRVRFQSAILNGQWLSISTKN